MLWLIEFLILKGKAFPKLNTHEHSKFESELAWHNRKIPPLANFNTAIAVLFSLGLDKMLHKMLILKFIQEILTYPPIMM